LCATTKDLDTATDSWRTSYRTELKELLGDAAEPTERHLLRFCAAAAAKAWLAIDPRFWDASLCFFRIAQDLLLPDGTDCKDASGESDVDGIVALVEETFGRETITKDKYRLFGNQAAIYILSSASTFVPPVRIVVGCFGARLHITKYRTNRILQLTANLSDACLDHYVSRSSTPDINFPANSVSNHSLPFPDSNIDIV
jgi:hypothetical protein